jgi:hypothetical protein
MAFPACFSEFDVAMVHIPNLTNRRIAVLPNKANLPGREPDLCVTTFLGHDAGCCAR